MTINRAWCLGNTASSSLFPLKRPLLNSASLNFYIRLHSFHLSCPSSISYNTHPYIQTHSRFEFLLTQHLWHHRPAGTWRSVQCRGHQRPSFASSIASKTDLSQAVFQHLSGCHPGWTWCHQLLHQTQACRGSQNSTGVRSTRPLCKASSNPASNAALQSLRDNQAAADQRILGNISCCNQLDAQKSLVTLFNVFFCFSVIFFLNINSVPKNNPVSLPALPTPTHTLSLPLFCLHLTFSLLALHTSSINHSTLNSDWRHSKGLALLAMLPSEYNSRPFCLPKWTLRVSSSLSKDPQITSERGWVMGEICHGGEQEKKKGGEGWQANDWEDSLLPGRCAPSPSGQPAMPSATA